MPIAILIFKEYTGICDDNVLSLRKESLNSNWSSIPPILTNSTITSYLKPMNTKRPCHMAL